MKDKMNLENYMVMASRTADNPMPTVTEQQLRDLNWLLGITGEFAEFQDEVLLLLNNDGNANTDEVILEAGDIMWYIAAFANDHNIPLEFNNMVPCELSSKSAKNTMQDITTFIGLLNEYYKKTIFHRHDSDAVKRNMLINDIYELWRYLMIELGIDNTVVWQRNIEKLQDRYKGVGFSSEESRSRKEYDA